MEFRGRPGFRGALTPKSYGRASVASGPARTTGKGAAALVRCGGRRCLAQASAARAPSLKLRERTCANQAVVGRTVEGC